MAEEQKNKTLNIPEETHARVLETAKRKGKVLYRFTDELINNALDIMERTEREIA